jgi:hypothetical protein
MCYVALFIENCESSIRSKATVVVPITRRERGGDGGEEIWWQRLDIRRQIVGEDDGDLGEDGSDDGGCLLRRRRGGADGASEEEVARRGEEEARGVQGRMKGADGGGQHRAEGRKVPFYSGSQLGLCLVGCAALVDCFLFS